MPPECEEIEGREAPEKISCLDGRIKDHLRFATNATLCGRRVMVNKIWCQDLARKWFYRKEEPPHARLLTEPKCQKHVANWYLIYRGLIFMAWAVIVVCSIFEFGSFNPMVMYDKWPIYLTNWDLALGLGQASLGLFLVSRRWKLQKLADFDPGYLVLGITERIYWFLFVVTMNIAIVVTITYWCSVYDPKIHHLDPLNVMLHICNSILMFVDFCVTSIPFRLRNFWWCLTIAFLYVMFSLVYYTAGGLDRFGYHYIYKILDWKKPLQATLVCVGEAIFISILYSIMCLLEKVKHRVYGKIGGRSFDLTQSSIVDKRADIV
ncbi:PREDICTED: protein rolling stone-like [Dufourea novaeangliae]|uniref:Protein rolling stone n=1 Tax=Dufourea novaeangliae TaxID=178035 RepID=A0A154P335_DUFNO|nr:PREDICTED: protein rolling stone-like [Dufourea novaeangliae]KZC06281.1 Protein rolling stone [Dufourea novaeangliae]